MQPVPYKDYVGT